MTESIASASLVDDDVRAAAGLVRDRGPAELVVGDVLADRALDHGRAGQGDRGVALHHDEVGDRGVQRGVAEARAEHRGDARDRRAALGRLQERAEVERHAGEAPAQQVRQAAAVVVGEEDQRHPALARPLGDAVLLAHVHRRGRARRARSRRSPRRTPCGRRCGPSPVMIASPGEGASRRSSGSASRPISRHEPSSTSASMRSRAVRRPERMVARDPLLAAHGQRLRAPALEILQRSRARRLVDHGRALTLPTAHQGGQHTPKSTNRLVISGDRRLVGEARSRC